MSNPFLGMINIVGFNFAPVGYAFCDGAILSINQNQSLFALIGTTYGGDGRSTFGLPELRGRVPIHKGSSNGDSVSLGQKSGEEKHTLTVGEIPGHDHVAKASADNADTPIAAGNLLAAANNVYRTADGLTALNPQSVANAGASQGHENMMPFGTLNFIIALQGVFPSRN